MLRSLTLAALVLAGGCLPSRSFNCESDDQCRAAPEGACGVDDWCTYPADQCASGQRYGPSGPPGQADACTVDPGGTGADAGQSGTSASTVATDDGQTTGNPTDLPKPASTCGNGIVEAGESCDDGNRIPGDGCHPQCVEPGEVLWTSGYDGPTHEQDRGFRLVVDETRDAIYTTGFTTNEAEDEDILLQRWSLATGDLVWTETVTGSGNGKDWGEHLALDSQGNVIAVGFVTIADDDQDSWAAEFTPDGETVWSWTSDLAGINDGARAVAVGAEDRIIIGGFRDQDGDPAAWMRWYDQNGEPDGADIFRAEPGSANAAIDVLADGREFMVTGSLGAGDPSQLWTARYGDGDDQPMWEDLIQEPNAGNVVRGVGQAFDGSGGSASAGVLFNDIYVQRYDAAGARGEVIRHAGDDGSHDEAADIRFWEDGSYVVVGFVDFTFTVNATSDIWIRRYAADGSELWTDQFDGDAEGGDKALSLELTSDWSVVVTGYESVHSARIDVWLRRYAL